MKYRKLDENGDYTFGLGDNGFYIDSDAVRQAISTNLKLLQGEWWEDLGNGLPLFQDILNQFGPDGNKNVVDLILRERIISTQGVNSILSFESQYLNRQYTFMCNVDTVYGVVTINNVNLLPTLGG